MGEHILILSTGKTEIAARRKKHLKKEWDTNAYENPSTYHTYATGFQSLAQFWVADYDFLETRPLICQEKLAKRQAVRDERTISN